MHVDFGGSFIYREFWGNHFNRFKKSNKGNRTSFFPLFGDGISDYQPNKYEIDIKRIYYPQKGIKGYMSIEAALIVPWVIFMMILIIYLGFYMYDKAVLFQDTYAMTFRASIQPVSEYEKRGYVLEKISDQYGKKYFAISGFQTNVDVTQKKITVQTNTNLLQPLGIQEPALMWNKIPIRVGINIAIRNPTEMIRDFRRLERMAETVMTP